MSQLSVEPTLERNESPAPVAASRADQPQAEPPINVGGTERAVTTAIATALAALGLRRGGLGGLALVGTAVGLSYRAYRGHCPLYQSMGIDTGRVRAANPTEYHERGIHVEVAYTIAKPRSELFAYWRNLENLPSFMSHLQQVKVLENGRSHWIANAPAGRTVEWDAEIINEKLDELIAWRSLDNADVDNAGSVRFLDAPGDRGTEVRVVLDYIPPAGRLGKYVAMLFGEAPEITITEDLRRFKRLMEAGDIATIEGQSMGTCKGC